MLGFIASFLKVLSSASLALLRFLCLISWAARSQLVFCCWLLKGPQLKVVVLASTIFFVYCPLLCVHKLIFAIYKFVYSRPFGSNIAFSTRRPGLYIPMNFDLLIIHIIKLKEAYNRKIAAPGRLAKPSNKRGQSE